MHDVRKRLLEKARFELAAKRVFRLETCKDVTSSSRAFQVFGPATGKAWLLPTVDRLTGGTRSRLVPRTKRPSAIKTAYILARTVQDTAVHFREEL